MIVCVVQWPDDGDYDFAVWNMLVEKRKRRMKGEDRNWRRRRRRKGWMKRSENNGRQPRLVQRMPP